MNEYGDFLLSLAWILCLYGIIAGVYAGVKNKISISRSVSFSTASIALCIGGALFLLAYGFTHDDYRNQYVWQFSNKDMPWYYKISAIWGGMDGSMLLWAFMLSLSTAVVALRHDSYPKRLIPWVLAVANSSLLFFITIIVFLSNPFRFIKAGFIPPDGNGLNPLLQNPYMAIHPPMLYAGFTTFAIPFAFCIGAMLSGNLNNEWIRLTRRWTLIAWGFLTAGIVLGGHWAYEVLGWGGFWAWDPVENASFLPWLTGTAFLHSVMIQERKNMLKFWNIWLIILTYGLTVFGTFLTRSGVVQSVHAFANTNIGWVFLLYLAIIFVVCAGLTFMRKKELGSERKLESYFSREAFFLFNNLLFLSICFAVIWGVMFPVLSEAVTGTKQTVGIPFFNAVTIPLFLGLIFLMGAGPMIAWRKASFQHLRRTFTAPLICGIVIGLIFLWVGIDAFYTNLSYSLCFFVVATIMGEMHRGYSAQKAAVTQDGPLETVNALFRRHRTRYGGYLVHLGVVVVTIGITASMSHKVEKEFALGRNESFEIGHYKLTLDEISSYQTPNYQALSAVTTVRDRVSGEVLTTLKPEMRRFFRNDENTSEVAIRSTAREDLYLIVAGVANEGQRATMKVFINPLQVWLWIGTLIMLAGTVVTILPRYTGATVAVTEGAAEETSRA